MKTLMCILISLLVSFSVNSDSSKQSLTVLTAYPEEVVSRFETAFERVNPDIDLVILWRMPHDALPYLKKPQQGGVDVYWSAALSNYIKLKQDKAWQKLDINRDGLPDKLGAMPLMDSDGYFCATEMAGYGFAINPDYLKKHDLPIPKTWQDLAEHRYQHHLALPVPSRVGFAPMMIDSVLQQYGWEQGWALLTEIAANARLVDSGATFTSDILGSGERGIAPTIDFFTQSTIANGASLKFIYPVPTAYSPAQIAITAATQHADAAKRFVTYVLSDAGQKLLFHPDIRKLPVRPGVYTEKPDDYYNPFQAAELNSVSYNPNAALPRLALNNVLFDLLITEHHQRLQTLMQKLQAAQAVANGQNREQQLMIKQLLTTVPIDAKTAQDASLQQLFANRTTDEAAKIKAQSLEDSWRKQLERNYIEAESLLQKQGF